MRTRTKISWYLLNHCPLAYTKYLPNHHIKFFLLLIWKLECQRKGDMEVEEDTPSTGSLPKSVQKSGLGQSEVRSQEHLRVSHVGGRNPSTVAVLMPPRMHDQEAGLEVSTTVMLLWDTRHHNACWQQLLFKTYLLALLASCWSQALI